MLFLNSQIQTTFLKLEAHSLYLFPQRGGKSQHTKKEEEKLQPDLSICLYIVRNSNDMSPRQNLEILEKIKLLRSKTQDGMQKL